MPHRKIDPGMNPGVGRCQSAVIRKSGHGVPASEDTISYFSRDLAGLICAEQPGVYTLTEFASAVFPQQSFGSSFCF